jgi:hypothetical protein
VHLQPVDVQFQPVDVQFQPVEVQIQSLDVHFVEVHLETGQVDRSRSGRAGAVVQAARTARAR